MSYQENTASPRGGGKGFKPMNYEWTDAYEWRNLLMVIDCGYERNAVYMNFNPSQGLVEPSTSVMEIIAAGAPPPGLKGGHPAQLNKKCWCDTVETKSS